jgi:hypothetical protein
VGSSYLLRELYFQGTVGHFSRGEVNIAKIAWMTGCFFRAIGSKEGSSNGGV